MNPWGENAAGYREAQNIVGNNSEYFKDKILLMQAQENGVALDAEQLIFLAAGPSYDSDILFEVQDHDQYLDDTCAYQEEHVMNDSVQLDHVVDLHADHTSIINMIPYDQYVKDNDVSVIHSNASSIPNDTFMMIYDDMYEPITPSVSNSSRNVVVKNSLTTELATYREKVKLYERHAKFELTEREQKINEQLRLVISDHNFKEETLKWELHSTKLQLTSTINRNKSMVKIAPHDNSKENLLATFTPQKQLTPEQIFWSNDLMKIKSKALRERTKVSRPIKTFTVYPPNTPAALVPKVLPTKSQVKILIFTLIQLFSEFGQTCKKRITPSAITDRERGFKQTKACYLQKVIPFFKTLKDNFKGIQKALTKEVKEMKDVFKELEAEVAQYAIDRKHDAIELKNLLIANDNLIAECLSQEVFCVATNSELNATRFTDMHVANTTAETLCLALEAELANFTYQNLKDQIGNSPPTPDKDTPDFDSMFVFGKIDTDRALRVQTIESQITKLTDQVTHLQAQNDLFRGENNKVKQHYKEFKAMVNPLVSTRDKHAIDVEPIVPRLRNNWNARLDYLRHLKESVEMIRDIIEEAKVVRPLDRSIISACHYTKHSQELLEYTIDTCPQGSQPHTKQLAYIPLIRKKKEWTVAPLLADHSL
nr:hypothetical protein [Tanacetum cinerariifolium]GFA38945.1 hypothetical protein [Tanacetum cinerariifolium]